MINDHFPDLTPTDRRWYRGPWSQECLEAQLRGIALHLGVEAPAPLLLGSQAGCGAGGSRMASIGERFREALAYAARIHEGQWRKRDGDDLPCIPYLSHLLGVASLVLEVDGDEDEAVAALLHDAVEDHPRGGDTEREIGERFGARVLETVRHCTKPEIDEDGPEDVIRARRARQARDYIDGFGTAGPSVKLVAAADKLHNARAIVSDLREHGPRVWERFNKTRDETLGYYVELVEALRGGDERSRRLVDELERTVEEMHRLAGQRPKASPGGSA